MFDAVIGLEIHLAVKTKSKLFCACPADSFGLAPNAATCPVCLGLPGTLPTINREAVVKALMFSLALDCKIPEVTQFHRKNYFYPDAPKNYQISQFDRPIGSAGRLELPDVTVGIARCHLEEDAGRLVHPTYAPYSLVDLNRAGAALIEMVTEPDLRTPEQARQFLSRIRAIAQSLGVSDANPEEGKMRADVNVSVRRPGEPLGTKVEVKNLNSFKSVQRALEFEIRRQSRLLADGGRVRQETLGWDEGGQKTYLLRSKEEEADYRYFPEPDLPPMVISATWLEEIRAVTPELPAAKEARYLAVGLRPFDAELLAYDAAASRFFDAAMAHYAGEAQVLANWLSSDVAGLLKAQGETLASTKLTPAHLAALVALVDEGVISGRVAKALLPEVMAGAEPKALVEARGLRQLSDARAIAAVVAKVMSDHPAMVAEAKSNPKAVNALVGQVMRATQGKANPELVRRALEERLGAS
jgi:aspartyl-tRNA(Asn)/glutamyl-tRNA(Gln) amidotransferase subunit B